MNTSGIRPEDRSFVEQIILQHTAFSERYFFRAMIISSTIIIIKNFKVSSDNAEIIGISLSGLGNANIIGFLGFLGAFFIFFSIMNAIMGAAITNSNFGVIHYWSKIPRLSLIFNSLYFIFVAFGLMVFGYSIYLAFHDMCLGLVNVFKFFL